MVIILKLGNQNLPAELKWKILSPLSVCGPSYLINTKIVKKTLAPFLSCPLVKTTVTLPHPAAHKDWQLMVLGAFHLKWSKDHHWKHSRLPHLRFSLSFPPQRASIKRLFRVVISPLSCSLSFGIFQGTEAENKGDGDGRFPSQFWCLVKRKESDWAARFLPADGRASGWRLVIVWWFSVW